jgi:Fur family peroxide stress response transcriptional regulator
MLMTSEEIKGWIIEGMKEKGLKLTRQRLAIIDILSGTKSHPSAAVVFAEARKKAPTISLSTVYLTLDILKTADLIRELEFDDLDNRYEGDVSDHLNLICKACGRIEDFQAVSPVPPENIEKETGFKVSGVRLEYYGYCQHCRTMKPA